MNGLKPLKRQKIQFLDQETLFLSSRTTKSLSRHTETLLSMILSVLCFMPSAQPVRASFAIFQTIVANAPRVPSLPLSARHTSASVSASPLPRMASRRTLASKLVTLSFRAVSTMERVSLAVVTTNATLLVLPSNHPIRSCPSLNHTNSFLVAIAVPILPPSLDPLLRLLPRRHRLDRRPLEREADKRSKEPQKGLTALQSFQSSHRLFIPLLQTRNFRTSLHSR